MPVTFLVVPQWQGSSNARAMRLVDGAEAIRGDLPSSRTRSVEVPSSAGRRAGHRGRAAELDRAGPRASARGDGGCRRSGDHDRRRLRGRPRGAEPGRCRRRRRGVLRRASGPPLPESSASKAFHGMVLRTGARRRADRGASGDATGSPTARARRNPGTRSRREHLSGDGRDNAALRPHPGRHRGGGRSHRCVAGLRAHRPRRARSRRDRGDRVP